MSSVNQATILGRMGKQPEVRSLDNGQTVANFTVATSESYKDKVSGEKKENVTWHNVVLWGKLAEIAQKYLDKGDQVFIQGKIQTRAWEKDGITRYTTEIVGQNLTMLGKNTNSGDNGASNTTESGSDDLPW